MGDEALDEGKGSFAAPDVGDLLRLGQPQALGRRESIPLVGAFVLVVGSGRLKLSQVSGKGKEVIVSILEPGDVMVVLGASDAEASGAHVVVALDASQLSIIRWDDFEAAMARRPALGLTVIRRLASRARALEGRISDLAFKRARGRLAGALLRLAGSCSGPHANEEIALTPRLTQEELGALIGASRETVSHILADWKRRSLVTVDRRSIVIRRGLLDIC